MKWGPWYPPAKRDATAYELSLRKRLRCLLPTSLCALIMLCYLFMAADFVGRPDERRALLMLGFVEILLAANLVVRHNVAKKLKRVLAGCCVACGYDLRATADRCPECGTCPPK